MKSIISIVFLLNIWSSYSQDEYTKIAFSDNQFVAIQLKPNKDTVWIIGNYSKKCGNYYLRKVASFNFSNDDLSFNKFDMLFDSLKIRKKETTNISAEESMNTDFSKYTFRLVHRLWSSMDIIYESDVKKAKKYLESLSYALSFFEVGEFGFIIEQQKPVTYDLDVLANQILQYYKDGDYQMTLFHSKIYHMNLDTLSNLSYQVQEAELDAILILEFNSIYAPLINNNPLLNQQLIDWKNNLSKTMFIVFTYKSI